MRARIGLMTLALVTACTLPLGEGRRVSIDSGGFKVEQTTYLGQGAAMTWTRRSSWTGWIRGERPVTCITVVNGEGLAARACEY